MEEKEQINRVVERLKSARKIFFITGAGVSAESGVPTFRGKDGWWRNYNPVELASPEGFARDPKTVWEWYNYRRQIIRQAKPNPAHIAIAEFEKYFSDVLVATQNVDGLHQSAGNKNVVEIHGSIWRTRCIKEGICFGKDDIDTEKEVPPRCPRCNSLLRPDVVWFGEMLPQSALAEIDSFLTSSPTVDVTFVVGTSALFAYIQHWALWTQRNGAIIVEINLDPTPLTEYADFVFHKPAGEVLPEFLKNFHSDSKNS